MKKTDELVLFLDSILDDYYLVWECYSEYSQSQKMLLDKSILKKFSKLICLAYEKGYFKFYKGSSFNGEEVEINVKLDNNLINKLLDWQKVEEIAELRITASKLGIDFLQSKNKQC